jgi:UDP-N-acetylmuramoylalanine--D-glutamate ligase
MGSPAIAVGNIGLPFAEALLEPRWNQPGTIYVVEASSFQLEDIDEFHPDVAIMTNFTADHLDRYGSLEKYFQAKQRIWKNMGPDDLLVVNSDDPACEHFAVGAACTVGHFTRRELTNFNADVPLAWVSEEGMIWIRTGGSESTAVPLISADEVSLPGPHNLENALAAVMASAALLPGNSLKGLCEGLRHFSGVPHRIELCGSSRGVRFYNDSKATNVDATEKALRSFSPGTIVLIAGGRDKQSDYGAITPLVKERVRALVTLGEAGPLVEAAWGPPVVPTLLRATTMSEAVELAAAAARPGDTVLLSPACASFDMYRNYEHRGDDFKATVSNHISNQTR